jgi:hypothetical protein
MGFPGVTATENHVEREIAKYERRKDAALNTKLQAIELKMDAHRAEFRAALQTQLQYTQTLEARIRELEAELQVRSIPCKVEQEITFWVKTRTGGRPTNFGDFGMQNFDGRPPQYEYRGP